VNENTTNTPDAPTGKPRPWWRRHLIFKLVVLFCLLYVTVFPHGSFLRLWKSFTKVRPQRQELQRLELERDSLEALNDRLEKNDMLEVEKQARNWGMIGEGDTIYHFQNVSGEGEKNEKRD